MRHEILSEHSEVLSFTIRSSSIPIFPFQLKFSSSCKVVTLWTSDILELAGGPTLHKRLRRPPFRVRIRSGLPHLGTFPKSLKGKWLGPINVSSIDVVGPTTLHLWLVANSDYRNSPRSGRSSSSRAVWSELYRPSTQVPLYPRAIKWPRV